MQYIEKNARAFPQLDQYMHLLDGHNGFIVGGFFKSLFTGRGIKDVDIFFLSATEYENAKTYFQESADFDLLEDAQFYRDKKTGLKIELSQSIYGTPAEILDNSDFTVTKFLFFYRDNLYKCLYHPLYFEHLTLRRLLLDADWRGFAPNRVYARMIRYQEYGFTPTRETKHRIYMTIKALENMPEEAADD